MNSQTSSGPPPEPITFVTVVNSFAELKHNLLASPVAASTLHEWIIIDNTENRRSDGISALYFEAQLRAANDLIFFVHQDVYLPAEWEKNVFYAIAELEAIDPNWGVIGAIGALHFGARKPWLRGHWADPHHPNSQYLGPLPCRVSSLDELWLGIRKRRGLSFDRELPGFHCYGIDLCLTAESRGLHSYAIDSFVIHEYRDSSGARVTSKFESGKVARRSTSDFESTVKPSKDYIAEKWHAQLPLRSTSMIWEKGDNHSVSGNSNATIGRSVLLGLRRAIGIR
jgi:hypothetical protein